MCQFKQEILSAPTTDAAAPVPPAAPAAAAAARHDHDHLRILDQALRPANAFLQSAERCGKDCFRHGNRTNGGHGSAASKTPNQGSPVDH
jgi:hypothetical protein